jgi:hypothetical protein
LASQAPGTLALNDPLVTQYFITEDPQNFAMQLRAVDLSNSGIVQGRQFGTGGPMILVFSYGSFNPTAHDLGLQAPTSTNPTVTADLFMTIIDASTGNLEGQALLEPGCHVDS